MKPIYRKDGWILCICTKCNHENYVEPHGTTAKCACSKDWTEHINIPEGNRELPHLTLQTGLTSKGDPHA